MQGSTCKQPGISRVISGAKIPSAAPPASPRSPPAPPPPPPKAMAGAIQGDSWLCPGCLPMLAELARVQSAPCTCHRPAGSPGRVRRQAAGRGGGRTTLGSEGQRGGSHREINSSWAPGAAWRPLCDLPGQGDADSGEGGPRRAEALHPQLATSQVNSDQARQPLRELAPQRDEDTYAAGCDVDQRAARERLAHGRPSTRRRLHGGGGTGTRRGGVVGGKTK